MSYIIIAGGVSVNDPEDHDRFPYNFINPAVAKAKALKASGASDIMIAFYSPSYEERVKRQSKEHPMVDPSYLPCSQAWWEWACTKGFISAPKDPGHFLRVANNSAAKAGATFKEIRSAADLTTVLLDAGTIDSLYYFGHSSQDNMFLEYSVSIASEGTVRWGKKEASSFHKTKFAAGAKFVSYGCNQGNPGGLVQQLSEKAMWNIRCIGSVGRTDYLPIGQQKAFPASAGGWVSYTEGKLDPGAVDIESIV